MGDTIRNSEEKKLEFCNILNLFVSMRRIIALSLTFVLCYLAIRKDIQIDQFTSIFSMIVGYYFGKSTALETSDKGYNYFDERK